MTLVLSIRCEKWTEEAGRPGEQFGTARLSQRCRSSYQSMAVLDVSCVVMSFITTGLFHGWLKF